MTGDPALLVETTGAVTIWRLNRPATRNAISPEMKAAIISAGEAFRDDASQRCLLLTGSDSMFCAGGDLATMDPSAGPVATRDRLTATHVIVRLLTEMEKPVITAVNGPAVGAGTALALLGDIILAGQSAYFQAGFPRVGALPDMGLLHTLPRAVGLPRAMDFMLADRKVTADEACGMGMISRVLPDKDLEPAALDLSAQLARGPGVSLGLSKRLMHLGLTETLEAFLPRESSGQAVAFGTRDFAEGLAAFREKRRPDFQGR